jgi:hypothetical protein
MHRKMPIITESAAELVRRMQDEPDGKKRQRLHAFSLVASGHARHRQEVAATLRVHRHSVAAWFAASTVGGLEPARRYNVPQPTRSRRLTDTALTALKAQWPTPTGFPSYGHIRPWFAAQYQVQVSYSSVYVLVRSELRAKPNRPRPSHEKKVRRPERSVRRPSHGCSLRHSPALRPGIRSKALPKLNPASASSPSAAAA